jgi:DNA-binding LytR/AlgR family response regulator
LAGLRPAPVTSGARFGITGRGALRGWRVVLLSLVVFVNVTTQLDDARRDGASMVRAPVSEILAIKAAGNYVEFALEDGRRPPMRASMSQVETALGPHGFVRSHRSWLVNLGNVRALSATGSGDFRIDLGCGLLALASRRYPAALARLRGERQGEGA